MKRVNVAVISAGGAGEAHVSRFLNNPKSSVKAVYDPKEQNLNRVKSIVEKKGGYTTTDVETIFNDAEVDAVSICSPDHTHFDYIGKAIEAKKHILVEKPLVTSLDQLRVLKERLKNFKKVFGTHLQMRYLPVFVRARELLISGEIGLPYIVESDYIHNMRERATKFDNWRMDTILPQKVALGASSHTIDLVRWIVNDKVGEVFSYSSHIGWPEYPDEDTVLTILKFKHGAIGKILSTISCRRPQYNSLVIYGSKGNIINNILLDENGFQKYIYLPKSRSQKRKLIDGILKRVKSLQLPPFSIYEHEQACCLLLNDFLDSVIESKSFAIDFSESAYSTQICLASIESYEKGCPIKISRQF